MSATAPLALAAFGQRTAHSHFVGNPNRGLPERGKWATIAALVVSRPLSGDARAPQPMVFPARNTPVVPAAPALSTRVAVIVKVRANVAASDHATTGRHCAFVAEDVAEVMRPLPIEALPAMPAFVLGLSIIRGEPTPVVDVATLLGDARPETPRPRDRSDAHAAPDGVGVGTRFVVMRVGERRVALAVEAVLGVRPLRGETLRALPPLLHQVSEPVVSAIATLDARLLTVLAGGYLMPPSLWERLEASKAHP